MTLTVASAAGASRAAVVVGRGRRRVRRRIEGAPRGPTHVVRA